MKIATAIPLVAFIVVVAYANAQTVQTQCGPVRGRLIGESGVFAFLGIPYATPPVGDLRWKATQSISKSCWNGTLSALSFGASCMQQGDVGRQSEDCLFLNIWTPNLPSTASKTAALLPTMLFIHGGGYVDGSGIIDGKKFVTKTGEAIVFVTINYRLNGFGFLSLKEFADVDGFSGNYGVLDMIEALKFVKKNIAAFGGDPNRVTIFGQSSGATGVLQLLASPLAKGLFQRAILESASTRVDLSPHDANLQNRPFVERANCSKASNVYKCLYSLTAAQVLDATPFDVWPYYNHPADFGLTVFSVGPGAILSIVDGYVIPKPVDELLYTGGGNDVPVIFGTNAQEIDINPQDRLTSYTLAQYQQFIKSRFSTWGPIFGEQVLAQYQEFQNVPQLAYENIASDYHVTCGQIYLARRAGFAFKSPVYHYVLTQRPSHPVCFSSGWCSLYSFHAFELFLLTDTLTQYAINYTMTPVDEKFADDLRSIWVDFATHGRIDHVNGVAWPAMDGSNDATYPTMLLNSKFTAVKNFRRSQCNFWHANGFYPYSWSS